jgi:hypothetical protein
VIKDILGAESSIDKNFLKIKGIGAGIDFFKLAKQ